MSTHKSNEVDIRQSTCYYSPLMRESILEALQQGGRVSGQELGKRFNVSRTAVWKHVRQLRKKGYEIDASPRLGYSLIKGTDLLLPEEIASGLDTHFMGKRIVYREEVTSTQGVAGELARRGVEEGAVAICERQTQGRGRKGRSWASPAGGGVYLSVILRPDLAPGEASKIALVAGVAVIKAIERLTPLRARIKWPNDIILNGKKVGGILAEMNCEMDRIDYIILGIGVNVNTRRSALPESVGEIATSLAEEGGEHVSRVKFVQYLLAELETLYTRLLLSGFGPIRQEWKALTNTLGSWVSVTGLGEDIVGEAVDIDDDGFLLVKKEDGDIARIVSGDVSLRDRDR